MAYRDNNAPIAPTNLRLKIVENGKKCKEKIVTSIR
jgi:hypothetical protein